ncbi:MAG: hypothetical protein WEB30_02215 [Cyclobacteriaceae bacterium]
MMHGYDDFPKDVKGVLRNIIHKFDLKVVSESPTEVIFKSDKCIVGLFTEYDYVQFCFKQQEGDKWMFLGPYFEAVYPNMKIIVQQPQDALDRIEKIRFSLNEKLEMVTKYCGPILSGDFSWKDKYHT